MKKKTTKKRGNFMQSKGEPLLNHKNVIFYG